MLVTRGLGGKYPSLVSFGMAGSALGQLVNDILYYFRRTLRR